MAKHAILSDIHGNWEALVAVCRDFMTLDGVRSVVSLGDIVGYGAGPAAVVAGIHSLSKRGYEVHYCMGNHDAAVVGRYEFVDLRDPRDRERLAQEAGLTTTREIARHYHDIENRKYVPVTYNAKASLAWTLENLPQQTIAFLAQRSTDYLMLVKGVLCVHASPRDPLFGYVTDARRAQRALETPLMNAVHLCLCGHSHIPGVWQLPAESLVRYAGNVIVMEEPRTLSGPRVQCDPEATITVVNVGSVGQPRDADPRACYAIYDDEAQTVELRRVAYDIEAARRKIIEAGLPKVLAHRLGSADAEKDLEDLPEG